VAAVVSHISLVGVVLKTMEFRGLLPGGGGQQVTLWSLGGESIPPRDCFEVLGRGYLGVTYMINDRGVALYTI
jgi:hypothetical protein